MEPQRTTRAQVAGSRRGPPALTISLLGTLDVRVGSEPVDLGGAKARALFALLLLEPDRPVPVHRLIAELWADPPATAAKSIQVHVSRIRRALGPHADRLVTRPGAYLLRVAPDETDLQQFDRLVTDAREADAQEASGLLRTALALWRGSPLSDLRDEPIAQLVIPALEERRLVALESRIDADLQLGHEAAVVGELRDLVARLPFREELHGQLMLALYRSGRQAEALDVYNRLRAGLNQELAIEPSSRLRELQMAVLRQEPSLRLPPTSTTPAPLTPESPASAEPLDTLGVSHLGRKRVMAVVAVAVAVMGVTVVVFLLLNRAHPGRVPVRPNSILIMDAQAHVVADVPVGAGPGAIAIAGGAAWVANDYVRTLVRVDLTSHKVVATIHLPVRAATLTAGHDVVWIGNGFNGTLTRLDPANNQLAGPFFPSAPVAGLLAVGADDDNLWAGLPDGRLVRLDPTSLRVRASTTIPDGPRALAVTASAVWSIQFRDTDVLRIDPVTAQSTVVATLGSRPSAIAVGAGAVWVGTSGDDRLWRLSPDTGQLESSTPVGVPPESIAIQGEHVWVTGDGVVDELDARTGDLVRSIHIGHRVAALAVVDGDIWAAVD